MQWPPEIGHQPRERGVVMATQQLRHAALLADVVHQPLAPRRPALIGERGKIGIGAGLDPVLERLAPRAS
jgi:hypothetical protein